MTKARRMTDHARSQAWMTLIVELVIVILGVFIGLQTSNWNDEWADRRLGEDYRQRLISDLQSDLGSSRMLDAYYRAVLDAVLETDRLLNAPDPDPEALLTAAYRASEIANNPPNRSTWDQIVSSGHLGLLPERAIEGGLPDYYTYTESDAFANNLLQESRYRQKVRSLIPLPVQLAIRQGCSDTTNDIALVTGFAKDCVLDIDPATVRDVAEALRSSDQLRQSLRYQYTQVVIEQRNHAGNIVLLERVLDALRKKDAD